MVAMSGPGRHPRGVTVMRPVVATVEIVAMGTAGHSVAGGGAPSSGLVLSLGAAVGAIAFALRAHLLSPRVAAPLAVAAQVGLHSTFAASTPAAHHAHAAHHSSGTEMLLMHALSAMVTVLALVWQEQVVVHLVAGIRGPEPVRPPAHPPITAGRGAGGSPVDRWLVSAAPRRGPPVLVLAS